MAKVKDKVVGVWLVMAAVVWVGVIHEVAEYDAGVGRLSPNR